MTTLVTTASDHFGPTMTPTSDRWRRDLRALSAARTFYEEECGWVVAVEPGAGRVTVTTGDALDVLVMPRRMGQAVGHALIEIMQPAVTYTSADSSTFLTLPRAEGAALPKELASARVRSLPAGSPVSLPVDQDDWTYPPRPGRGLPPWSVVVNLARRVRWAVTS